MDNIRHYTKKEKYITALLIGASLSGAYTGLVVNARETEKAQLEVEAPIAISYPNPFDDITIQGKAAYVIDVTTGKVLFEKNAEKPLPLASITKVMTALVAVENASTTKTLAINDASLATEGESGLYTQEQWKLKDLLDFMLIESSNDGAAAIASVTARTTSFDNEMNFLARKIGLNSTSFLNETGLDINESTPGAYGSAKDVGTLFSYILKNHPNLLEATQYDSRKITSLSGDVHIAHNTNTEIGHVPNLIASKTGYTLLAGGNLAVAFDAGINRPIVIAVLGSSQQGRFDDVIELASTTLAYLAVAEQ